MSAKSKLEQHFPNAKGSNFLAQAEKWEQEKVWKERSQHIALEIIEYLEENDLTQRAFAGKVGITSQLVVKWLRGKENFTMETIGRIEATLGRKL